MMNFSPKAAVIRNLGNLFTAPETPQQRDLLAILPPQAVPKCLAMSPSCTPQERSCAALRAVLHAESAPLTASPPPPTEVASNQEDALELLQAIGRGSFSTNYATVTERSESTGETRTFDVIVVHTSRLTVEVADLRAPEQPTFRLPRRGYKLLHAAIRPPCTTSH